jgi:tetratricopeptide (TPR) repeat protein
MLEWSGAKRLYVLALSRPELAEQQPEFGRGVRNLTNLALVSLADVDMTLLLDGYVPGLPDELKRQVLAQAQGVPLYAVETVRMLLDRGLLVQDGPVYRPSGEIAALEIPESLHALAAARLDGLPVEERQLVQEACVLGKTFSKRALGALSGRAEAEMEPLLSGLIRKEVLSLQADPRQPERGQYGFLQELLRQVAYDTLSRRDRKHRHLAAVAALEQTFPGADEEVPEVIAAHLIAAVDALPDDPDAAEIRLRARVALVQAGERAAALAAPEEAQRHLDQAAALAADEPAQQAGLLERAGVLAFQAGDTAGARQRVEAAVGLHEQRGDAQAAARASVALAEVDQREGLLEEAGRRLEAALPTLEQTGPSGELAATLAQLGRMQGLRGELEPAGRTLERALQLAEALALEETLVQALTSKASVLMYEGRRVEARSLLETALARSRAAELHAAWARAANNLCVLLENVDEYRDVVALTGELEVQARQRGDREALAAARLGPIPAFVELGQWQEALARAAEADDLQASLWARAEVIAAVPLLCEQGQLDPAQALLRAQEWQREAAHAGQAAGFAAIEARLLRARNLSIEALAAAERGLAHIAELGIGHRRIKLCLVEALETTFDLDDLARTAELLSLADNLQPGQLTPLLVAQRARFHARLNSRQGRHDHVESGYWTAEQTFAEHSLVFHHAATQLEHAEWLSGQDRLDEAQPLLVDARETFERLEAKPWLDRLETAQTGARPKVPA